MHRRAHPTSRPQGPDLHPAGRALGPLLAIAIFAGNACGQAADLRSPRAVAERLVAALDEGDATAFVELLPPDPLIAEAFDCGRTDHLRAAFQRRREDAPAEFAARRHAGHRVRLVQFDAPGSTTTPLELGDVFQGCAARRPLTLHRARVELSLSKAGRMDIDSETWLFLRFTAEGPWYFAKP